VIITDENVARCGYAETICRGFNDVKVDWRLKVIPPGTSSFDHDHMNDTRRLLRMFEIGESSKNRRVKDGMNEAFSQTNGDDD
jgi:hypothetical protein